MPKQLDQRVVLTALIAIFSGVLWLRASIATDETQIQDDRATISEMKAQISLLKDCRRSHE